MSKNCAFVTGSGDTLVRFRIELIKVLISKGFTVHALFSECRAEFEEQLESIGVIIHKTHLKRKSVNPFEALKSIHETKKILNTIKPEFVFSYLHKTVVVGSIAAKLSGTRKIISLITGTGHIFDKDTLKQKISRLAGIIGFKIALNFSSKVIFQNPDDRNLFINLGIVKSNKSFIVNGSGVDMQLFSKTLLPSDPVFLCMSRLIKSKGLIEFAKASRIVKKDFPNARFLLYGFPDNHADSIDELEVKNHWYKDYGVEYFGYASDPVSVLDKCNVYVLLSYNEGTPRSVLEAMSKGRAIITTDASGCKETVEEGVNGYKVPVKDYVNASHAMKNLLNNSDRERMGAESWKLCKRKYDVRLVNKDIINIIFN